MTGNKVVLRKGTKIYYDGDMANMPGFGVVTRRYDTKYEELVDIKMDDGRIFKAIPVFIFSNEYSGNGSTRFVTKKAYDKWKNERIKYLQRRRYGKR